MGEARDITCILRRIDRIFHGLFHVVVNFFGSIRKAYDITRIHGTDKNNFVPKILPNASGFIQCRPFDGLPCVDATFDPIWD